MEPLFGEDMIEPSKSPWASKVLMALKKDDQTIFCCDFRYLNSVMTKDAYPSPIIDSLSKLEDAEFCTTFDLGSALVPLRREDRENIGIAYELGLFQWERMPFGLGIAAVIVQK